MREIGRSPPACQDRDGRSGMTDVRPGRLGQAGSCRARNRSRMADPHVHPATSTDKAATVTNVVVVLVVATGRRDTIYR